MKKTILSVLVVILFAVFVQEKIVEQDIRKAIVIFNENPTFTKETIIENDMRIFYEIERATYWNEYMFFSVNGGSIHSKKDCGIQVAKLNKNCLLYTSDAADD